ncbi:MAG: HTH domain-containing protein [Muribaculaceae bacterium]|nr:HTH domain-containing protein [Muribaculaceae bacterium]
MTLKERIAKSKEVFSNCDFQKCMYWNDINVVYYASTMFGSRLNRYYNRILMNRNAVPEWWHSTPNRIDCVINSAFKKAFSQVARYIKLKYNITPGRLLKLLDILSEGLPECSRARLYLTHNESLLRYLSNLNDLRTHYEEMTDTEIYDFSFDMVYDLIDELSFSSETLLLSLLIMYWIQRENHLIPLALASKIDELIIILDTWTADTFYKKDARKEFRQFMRKLLDSHLREFLKSKHGNKTGASRDRILDLIRRNPKHTAKTMASCLGLSVQAIQKQIAILKSEGRLTRIGPDNGGRWKVVEG